MNKISLVLWLFISVSFGLWQSDIFASLFMAFAMLWIDYFVERLKGQ